MIVDCDRCAVRGDACTDCVITVLLGTPPGGVRLDDTERRALDALAEAGMVPQLRLVPTGLPAPRGLRPEGMPRPASSGTPEVAGWAEECDERSTREAG